MFIIEEPLFDTDAAFLDDIRSDNNLRIIVPHLPAGLTEEENIYQQQTLLTEWFRNLEIKKYIAWYYTPMALPLGEALPPAELVIYDCMDELSAFRNAPACIKEKEALLFQRADLVFTGGYSLYDAKKNLHHSIYPFPSSIDKKHFSKARSCTTVPFDHLNIPHPRIGFFGVVDERLDIELLGALAALKPEWQFVIIGPTVKIDPASLPIASNIHYLGSRAYEDLPTYLAGWDVALIPFVLNESTRFISPTKTPEYLAGGIPVVSTSIRDVIRPYGENDLVYIADTAEDFVKGIEWGLNAKNSSEWLKPVDDFLENISWDTTWLRMLLHIENKLQFQLT
ncbi:MAG: glycosyltransferase [Chitinophagaceae bacterium]